MTFDLSKIVRPKIFNLEPYRCARDDFTEGILLDANENPHGPVVEDSDKEFVLNRYPDPHQLEFKTKMSDLRNSQSLFKDQKLAPLSADNLCLGVGSDESIDALIRACCVPGKDKIMIVTPTYGMYSICANINDVEITEVPLIVEDNSFQMNTDKVLETLQGDSTIKIIFITSPGNPTGALIDIASIEKILSQWQSGIVAVDEAYVDFCSTGGSAAPLANKYPNLAVLQTLSKSFGLAGVRLGVTFTSKELSRVLNAMKAPYNISSMASNLAVKALSPESVQTMKKNVQDILEERKRVLKALTSMDNVQDTQVGGLDANFIMVRITDGGKGNNELAKTLYYKLATESGVVVRFRGTEYGCTGCLRITVGTHDENTKLIKEFESKLKELTA